MQGVYAALCRVGAKKGALKRRGERAVGYIVVAVIVVVGDGGCLPRSCMHARREIERAVVVDVGRIGDAGDGDGEVA